jgi:hypothetical protein
MKFSEILVRAADGAYNLLGNVAEGIRSGGEHAMEMIDSVSRAVIRLKRALMLVDKLMKHISKGEKAEARGDEAHQETGAQVRGAFGNRGFRGFCKESPACGCGWAGGLPEGEGKAGSRGGGMESKRSPKP